MSPHVLLFDFGGTLDADGLPWARRFHTAYQEAGGALDFTAFEPVYQASDAALAALPEIRRLGFRAAIEAQVRCLLPLLPDEPHLARQAQRLVTAVHAPAVRIVARNRPILERLQQDYRLGIISNFTGNLKPCLDELGLSPLFAVASDSTVLGIEKPDPRIFHATLDALGASPADAWMVGDNFEADIRPALGLGLRACWMAPPERRAAADAPPHTRVASLPEFAQVLA
ncbi:MAG TPA: HAD family hydrolase [Gemmatimonadales bacterium]|nr:HAD family hydrolase [Gemmatimonadales bacterium]